MENEMPLDSEEAAALSPTAIQLGLAIGSACQTDSDGGRRITRSERRDLLRQAAEFVALLTREALD